MSGYERTLTVGRVHAGEKEAIWLPRGPLFSRRPVILCHGWGQASNEFWDHSQAPNACALADALAAAGFPVIAGDFAGTVGGVGSDPTFGNAVDTGRAEAARTLMTTLGCKSDKALLVAVSMGNWTAWGHVRDYPGKQAAICSIMPGSDLTATYTANRLGTRTDIQTAWGVTYPTALPAGADPAINYPNLTAPPYQAYYSAADTVVLPTEVNTFAGHVGGTATQVSPSLDHGDAIVGAVDPANVINFLRQYV